jgi:Tol biopolymer transport system component
LRFQISAADGRLVAILLPMTNHDPQLSFAELAAARVSLRPFEAVTIVRELALRVARGELPGVPSAHVIRLFASGAMSVEGPMAADSAVARAAHLLETLLPPFNASGDLRVPGALRLVLARALGTLDLPAYPSLDSFAQALSRFASGDLESTVRTLVARHMAPTAMARRVARSPESSPSFSAEVYELAGREGATVRRPEFDDCPSALTISDIRRARRATGLTLAEISQRSHISSRLLCELEWGYLRNWPGSDLGRNQLVRYAHAAGLDDQLVVRTVWPLIQEWSVGSHVVSVETIPHEPIVPPAPSVSLVRIAPAAIAAQEQEQKRTRPWALAALAIPALLMIGVAPALWERSLPTGSGSPASSSAASSPSPAAVAGSMSPAPQASVEKPPAPEPTDELLEPRPARGIPDGPAYSPAFASVGSAMFYHAKSDGHSALMRAETDGRGSILRITSIVDDRSQNFHARPSPDGTRIAFDSDRDGERAVYVADADGRDVRRISGEGFAAIPSWSPDGGTIAFVRAEPNRPRVWNLWTADLSTGAMRRLTSYRYGQPWGGSWFPDGRRIAYSHEQRLVILDLTNGKERIYPSPMKGRVVRTPAVSPDGARVMFQVRHDGAWMLELRNGSMRRVLADPSAEEYTWSPDGRRVAYHSRSAGTWGVWVMAAR